MSNEKLYDEVSEVLTWYEHPEECPFPKKDIPSIMYETLVKCQKELC